MDLITLRTGLRFLRFPVGHAYLWEDDDGLTLIDSGVAGSAPAIADAIRDLGHHPGDLRRLVLTHFHEDHIGSAAEIADWGDVTVYAHHDEAPVIRGHQTGPSPVLSEWEHPLFEQAHTQLPAQLPTPVRVDQELTDRDVIGFGGGAQVVAVPGHTPGSIALYLPEYRVLFTGDTIAGVPEGQAMLGVFNADPGQAVRSLRRQAALDTEIACFGHGEPLTRHARAELRAAAARVSG